MSLTPAHVLTHAAGGTLATSTVLQNFARATHLRVVLLSYYTGLTAVNGFGDALPTLPFYQISEIEVGRCSLFGYYLPDTNM